MFVKDGHVCQKHPYLTAVSIQKLNMYTLQFKFFVFIFLVAIYIASEAER